MDADQKKVAGYARSLTVASKILASLSCILLFAMMLLTFSDVLGRYVFLSPLPAAYEIISLMMPGIIFCALPLTVLREANVTVDLFDTLIPMRLMKLQGALVNLVSAMALGLMTWRLGVKAHEDRFYETITDELLLQIWPFGVGMAAMSGVATIAAIVNACTYLFDQNSCKALPE